MVTLLITTVLVLGLIAIAIYFWQKPASKPENLELPPPRAARLFADEAQFVTSEATEERVLTAGEVEQQRSEQEQTEPRVTSEEVHAFIKTWRESPDKKSTADMLHLAASTDDAGLYCETVELALNSWQRGDIHGLSAVELQALINAEYWLLSSQTRSSGAGFVLKRTLSRAKRELETVNNPT